MKRIILTLALFFTIVQSNYSQNWLYDLDDAMELASKENKTILLAFQGSDWCRPCVMLKEEILETETFRLYAKDHFILVEADFPQRPENALSPEQQEKNRILGLQYNPKGIFPMLLLLDHEGSVKGETGYYPATPSEYILHLESFIKK